MRLRLRAVPKADPSLVMDPLGVLCYLRHGRTFTPDEWYEAGKLLGLQAPGMLAAAANDETSTGFAGHRELVEPLAMLRSRLVKAVGVAD